MCLDTVDQKTKEWRGGWKVVRCNGTALHPAWSPIFHDHEEFPYNEWIKDKHEKRISSRYPCGFHYFRYLKDAETYRGADDGMFKVVKVKVRNVVATGRQNIYTAHIRPEMAQTGVAREIFLIE